jgi:hypothetical protein
MNDDKFLPENMQRYFSNRNLKDAKGLVQELFIVAAAVTGVTRPRFDSLHQFSTNDSSKPLKRFL